MKPLDGETDGTQMYPIDPVRRSGRPSLLSGLILVVLIVSAVAATAVWRGRNGDPFGSARSIPAEMDYVMTFDALALSDSDRLQAFVGAFAGPMVDAELIESYPDDLVAAIDDAMGAESGFTLTNDFFPWVGRSISIAGVVPELNDSLFGLDVDLSFLLSADVRDSAAAESFVDKVISKLGDEDVAVTATEIAGQPGYRFAEDNEGPTVALVLMDDVLLVGIERTVESAIAAKDAGLSIANDAGYLDTMALLPPGRMMSFYVAPSAINALLDLGESVAEDIRTAGVVAETPDILAIAEATPAAMAISLVDEGLLFSYAVLGAGTGVDGALVPDDEVLASLPEGTLGYVSAAASTSSEEMAIDEDVLADLGYSLDELSAQLGIDIGALLESLSGDFTLAVTETRNSSIAAATEVPVGVVGAIGLTNPDPVGDLIQMLEEMIAEQGIDLVVGGDVTTVGADGQALASYSLQDDLLVMGTGEQLVEDLALQREGGLLDSDLYRELDGSIVGDGLVMYVDVARIVDLVPLTTNEAAVFGPLRGVGFGGEVAGDAVLMQVLVLIDY